MWVWRCRQFDKTRALLDAQDEAKKERRGLWAGDDPVPPWEWWRMP